MQGSGTESKAINYSNNFTVILLENLLGFERKECTTSQGHPSDT